MMHNSVGVVWHTAPAEGIWKVIRAINPKFFRRCLSRCTAAASSYDGSSLSPPPSTPPPPLLLLSVSRQKNNTTCLSCQLIRWNLIAQPPKFKAGNCSQIFSLLRWFCLLPAGWWGVDKERAAHSLHLWCSFLAMGTRAQSVQSCILTVLSIAVIQFCYVYKLKIKLGVQTVTQVQSIPAQQQYFFHHGLYSLV